MIIQALYELAEREGLLDNLDFEKKKVDVVLHLDSDGKFVRYETFSDKVGQGKLLEIPRLPPKRTVNIEAGFLVDNSKYVLGAGKDPKRADRNAKCQAAFAVVVKKAAEQTQDAGLIAVTRFLEQGAAVPPCPFGEWNGSELVAFALQGEIVHLRPAVTGYWATLREAEEGVKVRCLVTGKLAPAAQLHPAIKRIPNGQTMGASLISFNAAAFLYRGLAAAEHYPMSRAAAEGYTGALNWLLQPGARRRFRYGIPIGDDAVTVFWTRDSDAVVDDLMELFGEPDLAAGARAGESTTAELEGAVVRGDLPAATDLPTRIRWLSKEPGVSRGEVDAPGQTPFYAVTLSGSARVVVCDWIESTAAEVCQHVARYLADLSLGNQPQSVPLYWLLRALRIPGRDLSGTMVKALVRAAFCGTPLPRQILSAALNRLRLPPDGQDERRMLQLRCSLIKAVLLRNGQEIPVSLDEDNVDVPYLLGRLFAVLERLQAAAMGKDLNASVRDRFFGAAMSRPGTVFPRLVSLSVHHVSKTNALWSGFGDYLERLKGQIYNRLPGGRLACPPFLTLEEQGLFAVGYYQQRESLFERRKGESQPGERNEKPV
jgi:CRISPR-associated protein Csd1